MVGTIKDPTLFLLLSSVGILLFGSIGYGIYTTVGPSSYRCPSFSWKSATNLSKSSKEQSKVETIKVFIKKGFYSFILDRLSINKKFE